MSKTKTTKGTELGKAEELMTRYALLQKSWETLANSIKEELNDYKKQMDGIEEELIAIGESNRHLFVDDNLKFNDGYLHISNNAKVVLAKKFDPTTFFNAYPEMVDMTKAIKLAPVKKAFLDATERRLIAKLGVSIDTTETMRVIVKEREEEKK